MRIACLCLLAFGCAHRSADAVPAGTSDASTTSTSDAGPALDLASATDSMAVSGQRGGAGDGGPADEETFGCTTDADCTTTRVEVGGCCPMLCAPRVVTRERARALEANVAACNKGRQCAQPLCRPPLETVLPACAQNRCVPRSGGPAY
jgi:hypothetical protein